MKIEPLTPIIGAEIQGLDAAALSSAEFDALFQAFTDHSVIFLKGQRALTAEEHSAFAQRFGPIHVHPASRGRPADIPGAMTMRTHEESEVAAGNRWHSDVSCDELPPQASILQLHDLPDNGGDTLFSSMYAAYDTLSERMKRYLDGMTAFHSGEEPFSHLFKFQRQDGSQPWPESHHPIVRKHADSGRPALFVDREFTKSIDDLPKDEGRALLQFLFSHLERVDFQCRFRWQENDIAIWDNRCVLHHAIWDYWPQERSGRRMSVVGEQPAAWSLVADCHQPVPTRLTR
ncbi:MAG: taurine dioxygenase [Pseudomonadales bacterium]|nr:taurine dioxygenase [Pseudomonadales bacterium]